MDEKYQEKAIEALRDWSKWLISLNFLAGTGCVIVLEQGILAQLKPLLVGAILLFALAVLLAALVIGILAFLVQALPLRDESGTLSTIHDYRLWGGVSLGLLMRLQFMLFALGIIFVLSWVALKPAPI